MMDFARNVGKGQWVHEKFIGSDQRSEEDNLKNRCRHLQELTRSLSHKKSLMTIQNTTDSQGRPNGTQPKTGETKTGV